MDGWETRRRRMAGHDWCVIKLGSGMENDDDGDDDDCGAGPTGINGTAFTISNIELDTAYFTGNQTPRVSIEAIKVTRRCTTSTTVNENGEQQQQQNDDEDNEDYLYNWMSGASTRLARGTGGKGIRGTGQSPTTIRRALEACRTVAQNTQPQNTTGEWITVLPMTPLRPGYEESRYHAFEVGDEAKERIRVMGGVTHLKLNYYPDGGVARLKVFGHRISNAEHTLSILNAWQRLAHTNSAGVEQYQKGAADTSLSSTVNDSATQNNKPKIHPHTLASPPLSVQPHPHPELSSELHGGLGLACSNKHYGVPSYLLRPHPGKDMGDGWETARHPDRPPVVVQDPATGLQDTPLKDWSVIKFGLGGARDGEGVSRIIVDTRHFKGNFPESVAVDGCHVDPEEISDEAVCASAGEENTQTKNLEWFPLLRRTPMTAHAEHEFLREFGHVANGRRGVTHARISITPDGGLSRVRIYGCPKMGGGSAAKAVPRSHL